MNKKDLLREAVRRWLEDNDLPKLALGAKCISDAAVVDLDKLIYWYKEADEMWSEYAEEYRG